MTRPEDGAIGHRPDCGGDPAGPDAIIAADRDWVITFWNAGAERAFGLTAAEAVGQSRYSSGDLRGSPASVRTEQGCPWSSPST
jgi:hypothetical protein